MSSTNSSCPRCHAPAYTGFLEVECVTKNCPNFNAKVFEEHKAEQSTPRVFDTVPKKNPFPKLRWPTTADAWTETER